MSTGRQLSSQVVNCLSQEQSRPGIDDADDCMTQSKAGLPAKKQSRCGLPVNNQSKSGLPVNIQSLGIPVNNQSRGKIDSKLSQYSGLQCLQLI